MSLEQSQTKFSWVLASGSPRRRALVKQLGITPLLLAAEIDEIPVEGEWPERFAQRMACEKALEVASQMTSPCRVIGGDTVVALGKRILGKPTSSHDAKEMLNDLSGQSHEVWSGWAIVERNVHGDTSILTSGVSRAEVQMNQLSAQEIREYVETGEPLDKAGSYGIQGLGGRLVSHLEGSLYGVIGMPLEDLACAIQNLDQSEDHELTLRGIRLREQAATAAWRSGRSIDQVNIVAVSKRKPVEEILKAGERDFTHFGESYLQELISKQQEVHAKWSTVSHTEKPTWHYIGKIQTNKARQIGRYADWVHGISRVEEAKRIALGAEDSGSPINGLLQVNLADEASKGGCAPEHVPVLLDACDQLPMLTISGLMTFPPLDEADGNRRYFQRLYQLRSTLEDQGWSLPHLSMGTSHDFQVAIEEGATWIRPGRTLFGER